MPRRSVRYCSRLARGLESPSRCWRSSTPSSTISSRGLRERRASLLSTRGGPASNLARSRLQSSFSCPVSWQRKWCRRATKLYAVTTTRNKWPCLSSFQLASTKKNKRTFPESFEEKKTHFNRNNILYSRSATSSDPTSSRRYWQSPRFTLLLELRDTSHMVSAVIDIFIKF